MILKWGSEGVHFAIWWKAKLGTMLITYNIKACYFRSTRLHCKPQSKEIIQNPFGYSKLNKIKHKDSQSTFVN